MSYSRGFKKGYQQGFNAAFKMVLGKVGYSIEFAGLIRKKQLKIITEELAQQRQGHTMPEPTCCYSKPWQGECGSKAILDNGQCERHGTTTAMIIPNNPEVAYRRKLKEVCDTFIEMPFRLKFLRPDGSKFLDKNGKEQGPKFSCAVGIITPIGLKAPSRVIEYDFRPGFYEK